MSFEPDNVDKDLDVESLLSDILEQLKVLNMRIEEAFNTKLKESDINE
jgi:hypothetical protein